MIPYSSQYQKEYKRIYNQCYHEMRESLNIQPVDYIQDDSFFEYFWSFKFDLLFIFRKTSSKEVLPTV